MSSNENTQKPPEVKKPRRWLSRLMWISGLSLLFLACLGIGVGLGAWFWISYDLPKIERLADYHPPVVTTILAADGSLMAEFSRERRYLVPVDQLPKHVVGAFVSAEDGGFFDHQGLDYMGILRAAYANLRAGRVVQGGSTITQQVARALLLSPDRTYLRKVKEMILAWRIENYLSKDDILYLYLNQIYLGHGAYGVEAASRTYFGKHASQLNLAEAALLAGLVQAPSRYSPLRHPRRARNRQVYVIGRMLEDGRITSAQAEEAINQQLQVSLHRAPSVDAPYYSETVRQWLEERYGKNVLYEGGLTVHTACDPRLTELAYQSTETGLAALTRRQGFRGPVDKVSPEKAKSMASAPVSEPHLQSGQVLKAVVTRVDEKNQRVSLRMGPEKGVLTLEDLKWARKPTEDLDHWPAPVKSVSQVLALGDVVNVRLGKYQKTQRSWELELVQEPVSQAALLAMETGSGKVRVLLGGRDFAKSQYNRATQAHRQPGSAFKPFIYAAALDDREKTYTPVSIFMDAPVVYDDPSTPMQKWKPKNYENRFYGPTTLREALEHSRNVVTIKLLAQLGMDYTIDYARRYGIESPLNRTLSLALGTSGISLLELTRAYAVFANQGKLVEPMLVERVDDSRGQTIYNAEPQVKQVISAQTAYLMTYLLSGVMTNGTGRSLQIGRPSAGKTGTSNDLRDAWFLGYTPQLVCGVWVGQDDNKPLGRKETGARAAGPIWREFMKEALANQEPLDFPVAEGVVFHRIDRQTGRSLPPGDNGGFFEAFLAGTEPPPPSPIPTQPADPEDFLQSETFAPHGVR